MLNSSNFEQFFKDNEKKFFKKIFFLVKNEDTAFDIFQESMIKLMEHYSEKPVSELPLLFHTIVSNCINDYFRKNNNKTVQYISDFNIEDENEADFIESISSEESQDFQFNNTYSQEILSFIQEGLNLLPLRQKEAFLLRYMDELSITETAEIMKCSEGSVKTHCSRACISLAKYLKEKGIQ